jgi:hypothetical protein
MSHTLQIHFGKPTLPASIFSKPTHLKSHSSKSTIICLFILANTHCVNQVLAKTHQPCYIFIYFSGSQFISQWHIAFHFHFIPDGRVVVMVVVMMMMISRIYILKCGPLALPTVCHGKGIQENP